MIPIGTAFYAQIEQLAEAMIASGVEFPAQVEAFRSMGLTIGAGGSGAPGTEGETKCPYCGAFGGGGHGGGCPNFRGKRYGMPDLPEPGFRETADEMWARMGSGRHDREAADRA